MMPWMAEALILTRSVQHGNMHQKYKKMQTFWCQIPILDTNLKKKIKDMGKNIHKTI